MALTWVILSSRYRLEGRMGEGNALPTACEPTGLICNFFVHLRKPSGLAGASGPELLSQNSVAFLGFTHEWDGIGASSPFARRRSSTSASHSINHPQKNLPAALPGAARGPHTYCTAAPNLGRKTMGSNKSLLRTALCNLSRAHIPDLWHGCRQTS